MTIKERRERERLALRREILEVAEKLFAQKGYHETTMDDIAEAVELAKGTLYLHFKNKEELFLTIIEDKATELIFKVRAVVEGPEDPAKKIERLVITHLNFFEEDKEFFQIMAAERSRFELGMKHRLREEMMAKFQRCLDLIEGVMKDGISENLLKDISPRSLAVALVGLLHSFTAQWILQGRQDSLTGQAPLILDLFYNGVKL